MINIPKNNLLKINTNNPYMQLLNQNPIQNNELPIGKFILFKIYLLR